MHIKLNFNVAAASETYITSIIDKLKALPTCVNVSMLLLCIMHLFQIEDLVLKLVFG